MATDMTAEAKKTSAMMMMMAGPADPGAGPPPVGPPGPLFADRSRRRQRRRQSRNTRYRDPGVSSRSSSRTQQHSSRSDRINSPADKAMQNGDQLYRNKMYDGYNDYTPGVAEYNPVPKDNSRLGDRARGKQRVSLSSRQGRGYERGSAGSSALIYSETTRRDVWKTEQPITEPIPEVERLSQSGHFIPIEEVTADEDTAVYFLNRDILTLVHRYKSNENIIPQYTQSFLNQNLTSATQISLVQPLAHYYHPEIHLEFSCKSLVTPPSHMTRQFL
jgi:hypothetical protein